MQHVNEIISWSSRVYKTPSTMITPFPMLPSNLREELGSKMLNFG